MDKDNILEQMKAPVDFLTLVVFSSEEEDPIEPCVIELSTEAPNYPNEVEEILNELKETHSIVEIENTPQYNPVDGIQFYCYVCFKFVDDVSVWNWNIDEEVIEAFREVT